MRISTAINKMRAEYGCLLANRGTRQREPSAHLSNRQESPLNPAVWAQTMGHLAPVSRRCCASASSATPHCDTRFPSIASSCLMPLRFSSGRLVKSGLLLGLAHVFALQFHLRPRDLFTIITSL